MSKNKQIQELSTLTVGLMESITELREREVENTNLISTLKKDIRSLKGQDEFTDAMYIHRLRQLYDDAKTNYDIKLAWDLLDAIKEISDAPRREQ